MMRTSQRISMMFLFLGAAMCVGGCEAPSGMPPPPNPATADMSVPPSIALPVVADGAPRSGTRLKVAYATGDGLISPVALIDLDLSEMVCTPRLASDGQWHCLPLFYDVPTSYFVDAACSLPLYARAGAAPLFLTLQTSAGAQVFAPAPYQGLSMVYLTSGASCQSRGLPGAFTGLTLFSLGGVVPIDTFAHVPLARGM